MKRRIQHFQVVRFEEHPVVFDPNGLVHEFDIVLQKEKPFNQLAYNKSLLEKLFHSTREKLEVFLSYQCKQLKKPYQWLQSIRVLFNLNKDELVRLVDGDRLNQIYAAISNVEQYYEQIIIGQQSIELTIPVNQVNKEEFDIDQVKQDVKALHSWKEVLGYLLRKKTDYLQAFDPSKKRGDHYFLDQIELEIKLQKKLYRMKKDKGRSNQSTITWHGQVNELVGLFLECQKVKSRNGKLLIQSQRKELMEFIYTYFRKPNGSRFSKQSLMTYLSPSKESKLPKRKQNISVESIIKHSKDS